MVKLACTYKLSGEIISLMEDAANQNKITDILRISGEIERLLNKRTFEARTRN